MRSLTVRSFVVDASVVVTREELTISAPYPPSLISETSCSLEMSDGLWTTTARGGRRVTVVERIPEFDAGLRIVFIELTQELSWSRGLAPVRARTGREERTSRSFRQ